MKEFIEYLVSQIVKNPSDVKVEETVIEPGKFDYTITVNQSDVGLLIGKEGKTIRSIRNLAKSKAVKENIWINVKINDEQNVKQSSTTPQEDSEQ